ncbi:MAG TPA: hypothetical protein VFS83_00635 [Ktedonobacterales bacterium]|nr:hypothetical protein [Ktedonobacterales bacterium]
MLRVKIFASSTQINEVSVLEQAIDHWLENEQPAIRQMVQSCSAGQVILTYLYDDTHRDPQARGASATTHETFDQSSTDAEFDSTDDEPDILPDAELPY